MKQVIVIEEKTRAAIDNWVGSLRGGLQDICNLLRELKGSEATITIKISRKEES